MNDDSRCRDLPFAGSWAFNNQAAQLAVIRRLPRLEALEAALEVALDMLEDGCPAAGTRLEQAAVVQLREVLEDAP